MEEKTTRLISTNPAPQAYEPSLWRDPATWFGVGMAFGVPLAAVVWVLIRVM